MSKKASDEKAPNSLMVMRSKKIAIPVSDSYHPSFDSSDDSPYTSSHASSAPPCSTPSEKKVLTIEDFRTHHTVEGFPYGFCFSPKDWLEASKRKPNYFSSSKSDPILTLLDKPPVKESTFSSSSIDEDKKSSSDAKAELSITESSSSSKRKGSSTSPAKSDKLTQEYDDEKDELRELFMLGCNEDWEAEYERDEYILSGEEPDSSDA